MSAGRRGVWTAALAAATVFSLGVGSCGEFGFGSILLRFQAPLWRQLSLPGDIALDLRVSSLAAEETLTIELDGMPVPLASLTPTADGYAGVLPGVGEGRHTLSAHTVLSLLFFELPLHAVTFFDVADLENPDECEVLNDVQCLLPYPSSRFLEEVGAATATGYRLAIPASGVPQPDLPDFDDPPVLPDPINELDGFSPTVQILMHFPQRLDLEASMAPVLLDPLCCGQSSATPYEDVRTQDARSLDPSSPTVLLDVDTGERVLHWVEVDARAADPSKNQLLFLRPGKSLVPGHRYIVAVRGLVDVDGNPVKPEPAFRALRSGLPTTIPALEARRAHFEDLFQELGQAGVGRHSLDLAFDFVVRSDEQLTSDMLTMRDDAYAVLATIPPGDTSGFTLDAAYNAANLFDCDVPGQKLWRRVKGRFAGPYYLTGPMHPIAGAPVIQRDNFGVPERNPAGDSFNFDIAVPCSVYEGAAEGAPLLLGHGLFDNGAGMVANFDDELIDAVDVSYIAAATDWRGLSSLDSLWIVLNVLGTPGTGHKLNNFPAFTGRLMQGQINALVLARMMKSGFFNRLPEFQRVPGDPSTGVFSVAPADLYYIGVSLGGIMGLFHAALSPDIERYNIDVGATNFSLLLQRSTQFGAFEAVFALVGLDAAERPLDFVLGTQLLHEQWVSAEPGGYARHITGLVDPPLPGAPPKKILMTVAWLDKQVSNQASEIAARTLGIPSLVGSLQAQLEEMPDVDAGAEGLDSAYVVYDTGSFDVFDPAFDAVIPPLANVIPSDACDPHARRFTIPASVDQLAAFLQPGGKIFNFCDGVCDAAVDAERPGGVTEAELCDPLAAP